MKLLNILKSLSLKNETFAVGAFSMKHDGNDFCLSFKDFKNAWHNNNLSSKDWLLVIGREKIVL